MGRYARYANWFSTTPVGSWITSRLAARIDPLVYRWSGGRFTSTGPLTIPQLVLTTTGRRSGKPRSVSLGYLADGDDFVVVASNFGKAYHPAWSHNLVANATASVNVDGRDVPVVSVQASDEEKAALWPRLVGVVPQFDVYVTRTDRDLKVFRLRPARTRPRARPPFPEKLLLRHWGAYVSTGQLGSVSSCPMGREPST
jgi:deazaflavin-dependent oxidoreductase (nitroreductase family)